MLEKTKLLIGAYYLNNPKFAQIDEIFKYIDDDGNPITNDLNVVQRQFLKEQIHLMRNSFLSLIDKKTLVTMKKEDFYLLFQKMITCFYQEFQLTNYDKPSIKIVESFPSPFEKSNFKAMNFNEYQAELYHCQKGIYLLEKYTAHGISEIMLAHELMHYVIGELTPKEEQTSSAPFMEEAIADFLGLYFLLKYHFIDDICIQNWLSFGRANCQDEYIGNLYFKASKQILWILKTCGIDSVKSLAKRGQGYLAKMDMKLYRDKIIVTPDDEILKKYISFYDYTFTYFNLSAIEYYVLSHLLSIKDFLYSNQITIPDISSLELKKAIHSLIQKGLLYLYNGKLQNPNCYLLDTIKITLF